MTEQKRKRGQPRKDPTKVISFRVPADRKEYIHAEVLKLINKLIKK